MTHAKLPVSSKQTHGFSATAGYPCGCTIDCAKSRNDIIGSGRGLLRSAINALSIINDSTENHKYGPAGGLPALCETIAYKLRIENRINIGDANRIIVTAGANMAFLNILFAITDPGDEVILPLPYYFNHEMAIVMLNCKPIIVSTDENYQLCPDRIRNAISNKTRAIVTISPNNPGGVVYPE